MRELPDALNASSTTSTEPSNMSMVSSTIRTGPQGETAESEEGQQLETVSDMCWLLGISVRKKHKMEGVVQGSRYFLWYGYPRDEPTFRFQGTDGKRAMRAKQS